MKKKKKKPPLHLGFDLVLDLIIPQLKKKFHTKPDQIIKVKDKHFLIIGKVSGKPFLFRNNVNKVEGIGPLPEKYTDDKLVELEEAGNLCFEALMCMAQDIPFDPSAKMCI